MNAYRERMLIRALHLLLSIPILGYLYGPVAGIPRAAFVTRWIAMPAVILSGLWMWQRPRIRRWIGLARVTATRSSPSAAPGARRSEDLQASARRR